MSFQPSLLNDHLLIFTLSPLRTEVTNRVMKIFLNEKLIRQETYKEDAGNVVGLRFSFLGAGAVKNVKLINGKEEKVYNDFTGIVDCIH